MRILQYKPYTDRLNTQALNPGVLHLHPGIQTILKLNYTKKEKKKKKRMFLHLCRGEEEIHARIMALKLQLLLMICSLACIYLSFDGDLHDLIEVGETFQLLSSTFSFGALHLLHIVI